MKRLFLLVLGSVCFTAGFGQGIEKTKKVYGKSVTGKVIHTKSDVLGSKTVANPNNNTSTPAQVTANKKTRQPLEVFNSTFGVKNVLGRTTYDLQTNGVVQRRVLQHGNNVSCAWTHSLEPDEDTATMDFTDRGTGYATSSNNGSTWTAPPTARLENIRTGFGGFAGDGSAALETYIAHNSTTSLSQIVRSRKVNGTWSPTEVLPLDASKGAIWPHSASSGNAIYILAAAADTIQKSNGVLRGLFFSRSMNGGTTWVDNMIPMPLFDSTHLHVAGGNSCSISARDSIVAVVVGDVGGDLLLVKSKDSGKTWTKNVIHNWPLENFQFSTPNIIDINGDNIADTIFSTDGSHSVTIDKNGKIHVAYAAFDLFDASTTQAGYTWFPTETELRYWNSDMIGFPDSFQLLDRTSFLPFHDCDESGAYDFGEGYSEANQKDAVYSSQGTITMPSITTTNTNPVKVIIAYTVTMDGDSTVDQNIDPQYAGPSDFPGQNYRDVMMMFKLDNQPTWNNFPVNITRTKHLEEVFPSVAENVSGNKLAVLYQADLEPGTLLQSGDGVDPIYGNMIICQMIDIDSLFTLGADSNAPCYQFELPTSTNDITLSKGNVLIYPNPASQYVNVKLNLNNISSKVTYQLTDITGRVILSEQSNNVQLIIKPIYLNNLNAGNYILKVFTDFGIHTEKITKD